MQDWVSCMISSSGLKGPRFFLVGIHMCSAILGHLKSGQLESSGQLN